MGAYHLGGNLMHKHKAKKFIRVGRTTRYKVYSNQLNRLKKVQKLIRLKSQPIVIYLASYTE